MGRLRNKKALITGAGSGIGAAAAHRFAQEGAVVMLADVNLESANTVLTAIKAAHGDGFAIKLDVAKEDDWAMAFAAAEATLGYVDVLLNNAGIALPGNVEDMSFNDWNAELAVNLNGVFLGTKHGIRHMKQRGGSIINMSSVEGIVGIAEYAAYSAGKAAVRNLTKSAALHAGSQGYAIRINSIHPGYIKTPMIGDNPTALAALVKRHPIGFLGEPEDIANMALFLASDESRFATGAEFVVDGGFLAQ